MTTSLNLSFAWLWILLGFISGMALGMFFQREDWLGGYASFKRRLYRLGHISFFGLGALNIMFHFTARELGWTGSLADIASITMVIGGLAMPLCCGIVASWPRGKMIFAVPVISLVCGGTLTLLEVLKS